MKIVIKIGTQSILTEDGMLKHPVIANLVKQIARLKSQGITVILVSSGAVASGRHIAKKALGREYGSSTVEKQLLASLGQPELMNKYSALFSAHDLFVSQLLLTKQDFHTRQHYLNIIKLMEEILSNPCIVPIINENDSVCIDELMFTDNDELSGLIAAQMGVDKLIILTSVKGVYDGHPNDVHSKIITTIKPEDQMSSFSLIKTTLGRGGMISKMATARKMSSLGITTHIAHAEEEEGLLHIVEGRSIGTTILPSQKKSSIKRYLAFNYKAPSGKIYINPCLFELLTKAKKVLSILPIGIESFEGSFQKNDLIDIFDVHQNKVGIGITRYGSDKLKQYIGQKNKPILIHYDYLHLYETTTG